MSKLTTLKSKRDSRSEDRESRSVASEFPIHPQIGVAFTLSFRRDELPVDVVVVVRSMGRAGPSVATEDDSRSVVKPRLRQRSN